MNLIPRALYDRMDVLHISGYSPTEKVHITNKYLLPSVLKECGLIHEEADSTDASIKPNINVNLTDDLIHQ